MSNSKLPGSYKSLPHHIASGEIHWYYSNYHQETYDCNSFLANLESPINLDGGYCGLTKANITPRTV